MSRADRARGLFLHGMILVVLGLLMGLGIQSVANPRMGLSAHTATLMNGILLIAMGAFWDRLRLGERPEIAAWWQLVAGSYLNAIGLFLAAVWGTSSTTPLHGAGHAGTALEEAVVGAALVVGGVATLVGCAMATWGLRGPPR